MYCFTFSGCSLVSRSVAFGLLLAFVACSTNSAERASQSSDNLELRQYAEISHQTLTPEETEQAMNDIGNSWLYGDGLGNSMLQVGATVAFPPYALVLLGNLALTASGEEPIGVGAFLEPEDKEEWKTTYSQMVSGPGRMAAAVSGEEYRTPEMAKETLQAYLRKPDADGVNDSY